jgi:hypothetical protein
VNILGKSRQRYLRVTVSMLVIAIVAGLGYSFLTTRPGYLESATVIFSLPKSQTNPNAYFWYAPALITSGQAVTQSLLSPQDQRLIRTAGGTANVSVALVNLYNEEYPDFGVPLATLTTTAPSVAATHRTFVIAAGLLRRQFAARQARAGARPGRRITVRIIADTGPVSQAGSAKRVLAGLAVLGLVAVRAAWGAAGRRELGGPRLSRARAAA